MKVQIASDLHLEHIEDDVKDIDFRDLIIPTGDILVLAGDIGTYKCPLLQPFLHWCSMNFQHVLWVPGNHEYYNTKGMTMTDLDRLYENVCRHFPNIQYLNNQTALIDNVTFIGTTLWSHIPEINASVVMEKLSDYRYICTKPGTRLCVSDVNELYKNNVEYLCEQIEQAKIKGHNPIVVSHHAPAMKGTSLPMYELSKTNCAFASDIVFPSDIACKPRLWIYGHTHYNARHKPHPNGYDLISNQYGYEGDHDGLAYQFSLTYTI